MSTTSHAGLSDIGRSRTANEDRWFADPDQGLYLVADGIGGSANGGLAAQIVAEVLPRLLRRKLEGGAALGAGLPTSPKPPTAGLSEPGDLAVVAGAGSGDPRTAQGEGPPTQARRAGEGPQPIPPRSRVGPVPSEHSHRHRGDPPSGREHHAVSETSERVSAALAELSAQLRRETQATRGLEGIGSTVVLALLCQGQAIVAHLGDSRAYLFHAGRLEQLTKDHTIAQLLLDRGEITPHEAASHPARGQLTRFVGMGTEALPEAKTVALAPGDRLLLCSDGLSGMLSDHQILSILNEQPVPAAACRHLIEAANQAGGKDNITAVIVKLCEPESS